MAPTKRGAPRYKAISKERWSRFYTVGKIFQIAITPASPKRQWGLIRGPTPPLTFRRLVVVETGPKSSTCLTIKTYENEAKTRHGVGSKQDEHAIIYTSRDPPGPLPGEEELRRPIGARLDNQEASLRWLGRLNYGEKFVVQHTTAVCCRGRILDEEIKHFVEDYQRVHGLWKEPQEPSPPDPTVPATLVGEESPKISSSENKEVEPKADDAMTMEAENALVYVIRNDSGSLTSTPPNSEPEKPHEDLSPLKDQGLEGASSLELSCDNADREDSEEVLPVKPDPEALGNLKITEDDQEDASLPEHHTADVNRHLSTDSDPGEPEGHEEREAVTVKSPELPGSVMREDQSIPDQHVSGECTPDAETPNEDASDEDASNCETPAHEKPKDGCHDRTIPDNGNVEQILPERDSPDSPDSPSQTQAELEQDMSPADQSCHFPEVLSAAELGDEAVKSDSIDDPGISATLRSSISHIAEESAVQVENLECISPLHLPQRLPYVTSEAESSSPVRIEQDNEPEPLAGQGDCVQPELNPHCASCEEVQDELPSSLELQPCLVPEAELPPQLSEAGITLATDAQGIDVPMEKLNEVMSKFPEFKILEEPPRSGRFFQVLFVSEGRRSKPSYIAVPLERQDSFEVETPDTPAQPPSPATKSESSVPSATLDPPTALTQVNEPFQTVEPELAQVPPKLEVFTDFQGPSIGAFPFEPEPEKEGGKPPSQHSVSPTPSNDVSPKGKARVERVCSDAEGYMGSELSPTSDHEPSVDPSSPATSPGPASSQTSSESRASAMNSWSTHVEPAQSLQEEWQPSETDTSETPQKYAPDHPHQQNYFSGQQRKPHFETQTHLPTHFSTGPSYQTYPGSYAPQPQAMQHHPPACTSFFPPQPSYPAPEFSSPTRPYPFNTPPSYPYTSIPSHVYQQPSTPWPLTQIPGMPYQHLYQNQHVQYPVPSQHPIHPHQSHPPYAFAPTTDPGPSTGAPHHDNYQFEHDLILYNDHYNHTFPLRGLLDTGAALNFINATKAQSIGLQFLLYRGEDVQLGDGRLTRPQYTVSGRWRFGPSGKTTWTDSFVVLPNLERDVIIGRDVINQRSFLLPNRELLVLGLPKLTKQERFAREQAQKLKEELDREREAEERKEIRRKERAERSKKGKSVRIKQDETTGPGEEGCQSLKE